jgi:uncharacterized small protein (DUF1192 family)
MYKVILVSLIAFSLTGCATIGKYIPSKFDNVEFGNLAELHVVATKPSVANDWCAEKDLKKMAHLSDVLAVYSKHRLNENIAGVYAEINSLTNELKNREQPSAAYCKIKRQTIGKVTEDALNVFGDRLL